jgi:hypothetical protein
MPQPNVHVDLVAAHSECNLFVEANLMAHYLEVIRIDVPLETVGSPPFLEGELYDRMRQARPWARLNSLFEEHDGEIKPCNAELDRTGDCAGDDDAEVLRDLLENGMVA